MKKQYPKLLIVGGFLGAGKTSLLLQCARLLTPGLKVAIITNDQAPDLVDTLLLQKSGAAVAEVSGSCFCCNFDAFSTSIQNFTEADIILAEPVGSCTDLSATILQPLKDLFKQQLSLAPLTVLVDPAQLTTVLNNPDTTDDTFYILNKQLEEADIILISKADLLSAKAAALLVEKTKTFYDKPDVWPISSNTGSGIADWLTYTRSTETSGSTLLDIDYKRYAAGEAAMGWLNASIDLTGAAIEWPAFIHYFSKQLKLYCDEAGYTIGHIKCLLECPDGYIKFNLTATSQAPELTGTVAAGNLGALLLNARVHCTAEALNQLITEALRDATAGIIHTQINTWQCFSPGYPTPTHRYARVI